MEEVLIPMRDGVLLASDVYLPSDGEANWPVVLERTPYGKRDSNQGDRTRDDPVPKSRAQIALEFNARGYVYVLQDCRGRNASGGTFSKYVNEGDDGVDTLKWLRAQNWCNGQIATTGLSYGAHVQAALASTNPNGLAAMIWDSGGFSNAWRSGIRQGGAFELKQLTWALKHARLSPATLRDPNRQAALASQDIRDWIKVNPWTQGHSPLAAAPEYEAYVLELWRNEVFSDFWQRQGLYAAGDYLGFTSAPTLLMSSWYDPYALTATDNFEGLTKAGKGLLRLILGPWTHGQRSVSYAGDVDFGPDAPLNGNLAESYNELRLGWFDQHVKNSGDRAANQNRVDLFVMGGGTGAKTIDGRLDHGGKWRVCDSWPLRDARPTPFYLTGRNSLTATPAAASASLNWVHDPENPVLTRGGATASGAPVMVAGAFDQGHGACAAIATFQTPVLEIDTEVTGPIVAKLWISSTAPDTDICLKLIDVYPPTEDYPDGFAMNLTHGILRLKFRNACDTIELMKPCKIYPVDVTFFPTSNLFARGHRIRLDVASSNFPHFDVNPNTGAAAGVPGPPPIVATNTVHVGPQTPSCIVLPIVESRHS